VRRELSVRDDHVTDALEVSFLDFARPIVIEIRKAAPQDVPHQGLPRVVVDWLWFLLTGEPDEAGPHPMTVSILPITPRSKSFSIRLDVRPWVSADVVLTAYREAQKNLLGRVNQPVRARNLVLFKFVTERSWGRTAPTWPRMMREWNATLQFWEKEYPEWEIDSTWQWKHWRRMYNEYQSVRANVAAGFK
jgi:hypothetical protein